MTPNLSMASSCQEGARGARLSRIQFASWPFGMVWSSGLTVAASNPFERHGGGTEKVRVEVGRNYDRSPGQWEPGRLVAATSMRATPKETSGRVLLGRNSDLAP
jgi:hypothetical protein